MAAKSRKAKRSKITPPAPSQVAPADCLLIPAPKLRRMIGVSAVTLWRWRQDKAAGFPVATLINGRNYFPWANVQA